MVKMTRLKIKESEYRRRYFAPGSAPDTRTVIARIRRGELAGQREGGLWYVYQEEPPSLDQRAARLVEEWGHGRAV
jgi:hypothetical protein